jgi:predicted HD phosphohydrolase
MPDREREAFRSHPYFSDMLALRRWDDRAKVPGAAAPEIDEIVERFIRFQSRPRA